MQPEKPLANVAVEPQIVAVFWATQSRPEARTWESPEIDRLPTPHPLTPSRKSQ